MSTDLAGSNITMTSVVQNHSLSYCILVAIQESSASITRLTPTLGSQSHEPVNVSSSKLTSKLNSVVGVKV